MRRIWVRSGTPLQSRLVLDIAQGCAGGVECALMSTSPDRNVALGYSGVLAGNCV